jgi:hypothetical protein
MNPVLDIVRRPETLSCRLIMRIDESVQGLEDESFVLRGRCTRGREIPLRFKVSDAVFAIRVTRYCCQPPPSER